MPPMTSAGSLDLGTAVDEFVATIGDELSALGGRTPGEFHAELVVEAANLVGGVLDADGRFTDGELSAYLDALGPRLDPPLVIDNATLRSAGILSGKAAELQRPSVLFDLLAKADAAHGTRRSHRYYERAMHLAHLAAAIDLMPSPDEIAAIDRFRGALLSHLDTCRVPRPGQPTATVAPAAEPATDEPAPELRSLDDLFAELDELVGLGNVKAEIRRLASLLEVQRLRAERDLPTIETSHHLVFSGNPGTGKTTVARRLSQIYHAVGVVSKGHLVETDRSRLVAGYVGQTALKTQEALQSALGGTLLVDEAYALARGGENDFGREAIDTLVKFMEDHRDDLAIVAAGYTEEMATFIDANPGLKSRFTRTVHFADYTDDELVEIFLLLGRRHRYHCTDEAVARVRELIAAEPRTRGFGNARFVRNLFETAVAHHAMRVAPAAKGATPITDEQLTTLVADDIAAVDA